MSSAPVTIADLSNYVESLQREVYDPTLANNAQPFASLTFDDWLGHLADAFWECRLDGLLQGYTCDENGLISTVTFTNAPPSNTTALSSNPQLQNWSADGQWREMVQLVVLYASFRILRNQLRTLRTAFSAAAGPVRFEYQQSALLLTEIMRDVVNRRNMILARLSDLGTTQVTTIDAIQARDESLLIGATTWVAAGALLPGAYGPYGYDDTL